MRPLTRFLSIAVLCAAASAAFAETEMILLNDGVSGMGEVVATEPDSITVKFQTKEGAAGETKLSANRLDPHNFYSIRAKHMEKTVENHVKLAVYCAENGLFNRAKIEMDAARKMDPELDAKLEKMPDIMEGIAQRLADAAKRAYDKGDLELCRELAQLIATRFQESSLADKATGALDLLDAEMAKRDAAEVADREKKIVESKDEEARQKAEFRHKAMLPIEARQSAGRKNNSAGLRAKNRSTARRSFEAAAADFEAALKTLAGTRGSPEADAELKVMLDDTEKELRDEAANAWINAGNIDLWRESFNNAMEAAEKAVAVDPGSATAQAFKQKVEFAYMVRDNDRRR